MSQVEFNDPHVMAAWVAVQMNRPGEMKTILVVESAAEARLHPWDRSSGVWFSAVHF
jgi:hypothetical protein